MLYKNIYRYGLGLTSIIVVLLLAILFIPELGTKTSKDPKNDNIIYILIWTGSASALATFWARGKLEG